MQGKKPFSCAVCLLTHTWGKPFSCTVCMLTHEGGNPLVVQLTPTWEKPFSYPFSLLTPGVSRKSGGHTSTAQAQRLQGLNFQRLPVGESNPGLPRDKRGY